MEATLAATAPSGTTTWQAMPRVRAARASAAPWLPEEWVTTPALASASVSDQTAFFNLEGVGQPGQLVEFNDTATIFSNPDRRETEDYISGRFG